MGRVLIFSSEKVVETPFRMIEPPFGHGNSRRSQAVRPDCDQKGFLGFTTGFEVSKTLLDEIAAR